MFGHLIEPANAVQQVWADNAYRSDETGAVLEEAGYHSHINEKELKWTDTSEEQNHRNGERARIRS